MKYFTTCIQNTQSVWGRQWQQTLFVVSEHTVMETKKHFRLTGELDSSQEADRQSTCVRCSLLAIMSSLITSEQLDPLCNHKASPRGANV